MKFVCFGVVNVAVSGLLLIVKKGRAFTWTGDNQVFIHTEFGFRQLIIIKPIHLNYFLSALAV
jgi:hypothetical protein